MFFKKINLLLIEFFFLTASSSLYAENNDFEFSFGFNTAYNFGTVNELLYYSNSDVLQSKLIWDMNCPEILLNSKIKYKHLFAKADFELPLPLKCGYMQDYDWLNYKTYGTTELSYYSKHSNYVNYGYSLTGVFGYEIKLNNIFSISPTISIGSKLINFSAKDGYIQYPEKNPDGKIIWTEDTKIIQKQGEMITYQQSTNNYGLGIDFNFSPTDSLSFDLFSQVNLMNYLSYDYHILRNIVFADQILIGYSFDLQLSSKYRLNKFSNIVLSYNCQIIPTQKGMSFEQPCYGWNKWANDGWAKISSQGGVSRFLSRINLGYELCL